MMNFSLQHVLLWLLLITPAVVAQEAVVPADAAAVAGQSEQAEQADADAMAEEARQRVQQLLRDSADRLEAELARRSTEVGPYDVGLAEMQSDLGRIYLELGDHERAIDLLDQALQLVRINRGLYDASQIPVLQNLVASYRAQSDWDNVDDYQHLVFSLQQRAYAPDSPEFADAVLAMGDWQVVSSRANFNGRSGAYYAVDRLNDLKDLYASVRLHAVARGDVARQWELLYSDALVDVEIARQYLSADMNDMMVSASRYVNQTVCRTVSDGAGGYQRVCWQESVSNPDYYRQVNNQRRTHLERARISLQNAQQEMQILMDNNPDFVRDNAVRTTAGIENLNKVLENLRREARRATLGGTW